MGDEIESASPGKVTIYHLLSHLLCQVFIVGLDIRFSTSRNAYFCTESNIFQLDIKIKHNSDLKVTLFK